VRNADATRTSRYGISRTDQWKSSARYLHFRMRIIYIADFLLDSTRRILEYPRTASEKTRENEKSKHLLHGFLLSADLVSKNQIRRYNSQPEAHRRYVQVLNYVLHVLRNMERVNSRIPHASAKPLQLSNKVSTKRYYV